MIYGDKQIDRGEVNRSWMAEADKVARDEAADDPVGVLHRALESARFSDKWLDIVRGAFERRDFVTLDAVLKAAVRQLADEVYNEFEAGKRKAVW